MKTIRRAISLVMAVIMLITGTPALQASDLALDRAQIVELQQEILQDVEINVPDPVQILRARYDKSVENNELSLARLNEKLQGEAVEAIKERLNGLKEQAKELAKSERYTKISREERKQVALNSLVFSEIKEIFQDQDFLESFGDGLLWASAGCMAVGSIIKLIHWTRWGFAHFSYFSPGATPGYFKSLAAGEGFLSTGVILLVATIIIELFTASYTPVIDLSLNADETSRIFSEKPFTFLARFENGVEYANLNKKCPELLRDAVDIEYYTSLDSATLGNMKDKAYIETIEWYEMTTEDRTTYLHNLAERLRAEARAGVKEQFNNSRIGLEER